MKKIITLLVILLLVGSGVAYWYLSDKATKPDTNDKVIDNKTNTDKTKSDENKDYSKPEITLKSDETITYTIGKDFDINDYVNVKTYDEKPTVYFETEDGKDYSEKGFHDIVIYAEDTKGEKASVKAKLFTETEEVINTITANNKKLTTKDYEIYKEEQEKNKEIIVADNLLNTSEADFVKAIEDLGLTAKNTNNTKTTSRKDLDGKVYSYTSTSDGYNFHKNDEVTYSLYSYTPVTINNNQNNNNNNTNVSNNGNTISGGNSDIDTSDACIPSGDPGNGGRYFDSIEEANAFAEENCLAWGYDGWGIFSAGCGKYVVDFHTTEQMKEAIPETPPECGILGCDFGN